MNIEKKVIEIKYSAWANYYEGWPVFELHDNNIKSEGDIEVQLTKAEVDDYREVERRYFEWQQKIREMAFPDMKES